MFYHDRSFAYLNFYLGNSGRIHIKFKSYGEIINRSFEPFDGLYTINNIGNRFYRNICSVIQINKETRRNLLYRLRYSFLFVCY